MEIILVNLQGSFQPTGFGPGLGGLLRSGDYQAELMLFLKRLTLITAEIDEPKSIDRLRIR